MNKPMQVQTCLNYNGPCEEALDFYRQAFDAEVTTLMWFKDSPDPTMVSAGSENKVMHSSFRVGDTIVLASDGRCQGQTNFQSISLTLTVPDEAAAEQRSAALSDGVACRCRWRKRSLRRASAWSPIASE
jgi:PhnB protein